MSLFRDTARAFDQRLRLVSSVIELPANVEALRAALLKFQGNTSQPIIDRLASAIIAGDDDLGLLWSAALAENMASRAVHNETLSAVRTRIHSRIRQAYDDQAVATYEKVAAVFDKAAAAFTATAAVVDIEAAAEAILEKPDKQRQAWRAAQAQAEELTRLLPSLKAAAELAGVGGSDNTELALAVDVADLDRRQIWDAWTIEHREAQAERSVAAGQQFTVARIARSRCGRWSAVLNLGARLRACPPQQFGELGQ